MESNSTAPRAEGFNGADLMQLLLESFFSFKQWFITCILLFAWWICIHRYRQKGVSGPKTWPVLGCIIEQAKNFDKLHDWLLGYFHETLTFSVPMLSVNNTFTANPANVEHILKTNFPNYPKGAMLSERFADLMGQGIFTVDGAMWMQQRKVATIEFASSKLREYSIHTYRLQALKLVRVLKHAAATNQTVDLQDLFLRLTLDSICKVGFGVDIGCLSPDLPFIPFAFNFDEAMRLIIRRYVDLLWKVKRTLRVGSEAQLRKCVEVVDKFLYDVIAKRRAEKLRGEAKADLLSRFMSLEGDEAYSEKMLRDLLINFMVAGRDTTALTMSWFFSELCRHPEVVEGIRSEVKQVVQEPIDEVTSGKEDSTNDPIIKFAQKLNYQTLNKMHYLHAAISEALRLYPAVPLDTKEAITDDILPDGTQIQAGQFVSYAPYAMGRLEEIWGPDACKFNPSRWLRDGVFYPQSPYKFTTFQAGPRMCLGKETAFLQMKMTTVLILRYFQFDMLPNQLLDYRMMAVLYMANGLKANVSARS